MNDMSIKYEGLKLPGDAPEADGSYISVKPDGEWMGDANIEVDDGYMAVNPDWLESQWELLNDQPWFRGAEDYRRDDATKELARAKTGTFVVRAKIASPLDTLSIGLGLRAAFCSIQSQSS
eukprot:TRINITY_DN10564_c0_g1_i10.p1 TRINITY_DN10564_c0_g1~~TRINITY_DN10564_c0_g1_i10.p1  ORF type:complete len:121 (+),score=16.64 TRINITY_DN10564_c0_g1_i10:297-659(+)